jgi:hypothetical protein
MTSEHRDQALVAIWAASSAALVTVHVFILVRALAGSGNVRGGAADPQSKRRTRLRRLLALLAAVVPPVAPWLAFRESMRVLGFLWLGFAGTYAAAWVVSLAVGG